MRDCGYLCEFEQIIVLKLLQRIAEGLGLMRRKAAALLTLGVAAALPMCAQLLHAGVGQAASYAPARPSTLGAGKLEFDAASVRLSTQEFTPKGADFLNPASDAAPPQGGLFSWNVSLPWLINFAYDLRSSQARRNARQALPKWAQDNWYAVEARAEGNPSRDDVRQMVRSLLQDRFQLAAHLEKREGQVYALALDKSRPGLKPHSADAPCTLSSSQVDDHRYRHVYPSYESVPAHCGVFDRILSPSGDRRSEMLNVTMRQIADSLGLGLPLSVVDKTGLAGRYDAVLDYGPDGVPSNADSSDEIGLPPLIIALEKQLGLKLVKQNAQVDTFVLDHVGELSEN
jgi:uncharacterized protein (TIGR03435 family)